MSSILSAPQTAATRPVPPAPVPGTRLLSQAEVLWRLRRNPLTIWRRAHFEEPVVAGRGVLGEVVVVSDPAGIRRVFVENAANYRKDDLQRSVLAPGLGEGLLTAEGEAWKRARRTVAPLFTPRAVAALADRMEAPAAALADRIARRRPGRVFDLAEDMTRVTYDVLAATLFSDTIAGGASAFSKALTRYFNTQGRIDPLDVVGAPAFVPRIGRLMARPAIRFFEAEVERIVAARRAELAAGRAEPPADLLTALLRASDPETGVGLSEAEVGANIVTFIGAGHETTANLLTWTLYLLSTAPDVRAVVEAEADAAAGDRVAAALSSERMPMTRAVLDEAMRLYPPVASLTRTAIEADTVAGHPVPKGAMVVVSPYVLHRHTRLWETPERFLPERFLPDRRGAVDRYAFLPFGAGPRVCVGMQFAQVEAAIVLSTLVHRLRFDHAGDAPPVPVQRITLRPAAGMPMTATPRR